MAQQETDKEKNEVSSITKDVFSLFVLYSWNPSVVMFTRESCPMCVRLKPIYKRLASKYENELNFFQVDADKEEELRKKFITDGVPTIHVFIKNDYIEVPFRKTTGYSETYLDGFLTDFLRRYKNEKKN